MTKKVEEIQVRVDYLVCDGNLYNIKESKMLFGPRPSLAGIYDELYKTAKGVLLLVITTQNGVHRKYKVVSLTLKEASQWLDSHNASPEVYKEAGIYLEEPSPSYKQMPSVDAYDRRIDELRKVKEGNGAEWTEEVASAVCREI